MIMRPVKPKPRPPEGWLAPIPQLVFTRCNSPTDAGFSLRGPSGRRSVFGGGRSAGIG